MDRLSVLPQNEWIRLMKTILPKLNYKIIYVKKESEGHIIKAYNKTKDKEIIIEIKKARTRKVGSMDLHMNRIAITGLDEEEEEILEHLIRLTKGGG